jgi:hypothetical protein
MNTGRKSEIIQQESRLGRYDQPKDKSMYNPLESIILEWSLATVGRSWNVIADILLSHPLASGRHRKPSDMQVQYVRFQYKNKNSSKPTRIDPVVDDKTPILGRFKTYLLANKVLSIRTQRYVIIRNPSSKEKPKTNRKRQLRELTLPYETRELKYKCTGEESSFSTFTKRGGLLSTNEGVSRRITNTSKVLYNGVDVDLKTPIYYFIKRKQVKKNIDEELSSLLCCRDENKEQEINIEQLNIRNKALLNSELNITQLLESPHLDYKEILKHTMKHNWEVMTNSWYQNHRNLIYYACKPIVDSTKVERNGSVPSTQPKHSQEPQRTLCYLP